VRAGARRPLRFAQGIHGLNGLRPHREELSRPKSPHWTLGCLDCFRDSEVLTTVSRGGHPRGNELSSRFPLLADHEDWGVSLVGAEGLEPTTSRM
jgi:hypothetical protein